MFLMQSGRHTLVRAVSLVPAGGYFLWRGIVTTSCSDGPFVNRNSTCMANTLLLQVLVHDPIACLCCEAALQQVFNTPTVEGLLNASFSNPIPRLTSKACASVAALDIYHYKVATSFQHHDAYQTSDLSKRH